MPQLGWGESATFSGTAWHSECLTHLLYLAPPFLSLFVYPQPADHDRHHSRFEVNYAFPFPFMDVVHGTYDGKFLGRRYHGTPRRST